MAVRHIWNDLADTEFDDGSPNQGLVWGTLWSQNYVFRHEQNIFLSGTFSSGITSSGYAGSPIVTERVFLPEHTKAVSVFVWNHANALSTLGTAKVTLWFDGSNEWDMLWGTDAAVAGTARTELESPSILAKHNIWNQHMYEGCGLNAEGNFAAQLPGEFELRLNAKRDSGSGTMFFMVRLAVTQQKDIFYTPTEGELLAP